jgi:DNA-binding NtrC family response regulator
MSKEIIPHVLIIDDLFGRTHTDRRNEERANLCGQYEIEDVTGDEVGKGSPQRIKYPIAKAVFYRGQRPVCSNIGDIVENDLEGTHKIIRNGWDKDRPGKAHWALVLLDLCFYTGKVTDESNRKTLGMPEGREGDDDPSYYFGLRILQTIHDEFPDLPVVILSSKSRGEVSREFTYRGALGFLPREDERSPELLRELIWRHGLIPDDAGEIAGHSKALLLALRTARRAASSRQNILIRGDRGTGKELMARYIHRYGSNLKTTSFVVVNSPDLSSALYSSLLFGIEKGVATSVDRREGKIKAADGGDLFFDEIGDMLSEVQSGILRVLEQRVITPVGSKTSYPLDVRFLSATNMDIEGKAAVGSFRSDLLDRLREGGTVFLPPLRERLEDIPILVEKFVRDAEGANLISMKHQIEPEALEKICAYDWPGNVRQLRSCIFSAVNNHPDVEHLVPAHIQIPTVQKSPDDPASVFVAPASQVGFNTDSLDKLLRLIDAFEFDSSKPNNLAGKLSHIEGAYARLIARYLKATLEATSQPTPENPSGKVRIHPAIKLMKGDSSLPATKAADIIKQLLSICPEAVDSMLEDSVLKEAYGTALRLRPRRLKSEGKRDSQNETG